MKNIDTLYLTSLLVIDVVAISILFGASLPYMTAYVVVPLLIISMYCKRKVVKSPISGIDICLVTIFIYEIINPLLVANHEVALYRGLFVPAAILVYYLMRKTIVRNDTVIYYLFSGLLLLCSIVIIISFLFFTATIEGGGFGLNELISLRYLFSPMGILINDWGLLLLLLLPFPLLIVVRIPERLRIYPLTLFTIGLYALILTFSRGAYIAVMVLLLSMLILAKIYRLKIIGFSRKSLITLLVLFIIALYPIRKPLFEMLPHNTSVSQKMSTNGRVDQWSRSLDVIKKQPMFGVGASGFKQANKIISDKNQTPYTIKVTNSYLQIFVEKGIVGVILYGLLIVLIVYLIVCRIRQKDNDDKKFASIIISSLFIAVGVKEFGFSTLFDNQFAFLVFTMWLFIVARSSSRLFVSKRRIFDVAIIVAMMIYLFSFYFYSITHKYIDLNQRGVAMTYISNKKQADELFSTIDTAKINSPVVFSNLALLLVTEQDTINYKQFTLGVAPLLYDSMRIDSIITFTQRASDIAPCEPLFLQNLGWLYILKGNYTDAMTSFNHAMAVNPADYNNMLSLGLCLEFLQNKNAAEQYYSRAIAASPFITESIFFNDYIKRDSISAYTVVQNAKTIIEKDSLNIISRSKLAKLYMFLNEQNKANIILADVVKKLPNLNRAWLMLGDIHTANGNLTESEVCYQKAHLLDKADRLVLYRLYKIYSIKKDKACLDYYKKMMDVTKSNTYMSNYFKAVYSYSHIAQETFPYNAQEYFSPMIEFN